MKGNLQVQGDRSGETTFQAAAGTRLAAMLVVAATYFYFLIYAEFALLELAIPVMGEEQWRLRGLMLALGCGGLLGSVGAAARFDVLRVQARLSWSFRGCAVGAALSLGAGNWPLLMLAAGVSGISLGALTVNLAAMLRPVVGTRRLGWVIGWGTGMAYAWCNLPWVFEADPRWQTILAAVVAALASVAAPFLAPEEPSVSPEADFRPAGIVRWVAVLMMLVWLDSAAFFVIQHDAGLKEQSWAGGVQLWTNVGVHLALAGLAGWLLDRAARMSIAVAALALLFLGCVLLDQTTSSLGGLSYVAGVSLYSVLLVYYPARSGRVWVSAVVLGIAGWVGSALGIGMVQDLGRIPFEFLLVAGLIIGVMAGWRNRAMRAALMVGGSLCLADPGLAAQPNPAAVIRGREVYIAEGCIHCHSQYVRPGTTDEAKWGPAGPADQAAPPLYGNRRQGPDLSTVGRRIPSPEWHRLHLQNPRQIQPRSRMPSYAHLFQPGQTSGEDLIAYLLSLGRDTSL